MSFSRSDVSAASWEAVLSGANLAAIGTGAASGWELFQFADATAVGPYEFELSIRLRGQLGTESDMVAEWPAGCLVVIIDSALQQIGIAPNQRGLPRVYRTGVASLGYADSRTEVRTEVFSGIGLRPYSVGHLRVMARDDGGATVRWTRRTRIDGDNWDGFDVPLAEEGEWYVIRVYAGATMLREDRVAEPEWVYAEERLLTDRAYGRLTVAVAQGSARFGLGPFAASAVPEWGDY